MEKLQNEEFGKCHSLSLVGNERKMCVQRM